MAVSAGQDQGRQLHFSLLSLSPSHNSDGSTCLDDGEPPPNALPSWWSHGNPFLVYLNTTLPCPASTMCPVHCAVSIPVSELYWIPHVVSVPAPWPYLFKNEGGFLAKEASRQARSRDKIRRHKLEVGGDAKKPICSWDSELKDCQNSSL